MLLTVITINSYYKVILIVLTTFVVFTFCTGEQYVVDNYRAGQGHLRMLFNLDNNATLSSRAVSVRLLAHISFGFVIHTVQRSFDVSVAPGRLDSCYEFTLYYNPFVQKMLLLYYNIPVVTDMNSILYRAILYSIIVRNSTRISYCRKKHAIVFVSVSMGLGLPVSCSGRRHCDQERPEWCTCEITRDNTTQHDTTQHRSIAALLLPSY